MGDVKALLVGVCDYFVPGCASLPLCKNDLYELKNALIKGLNVKCENIKLCGKSGKVTVKDFILSFDDSGHGAKEFLVLSDDIIPLEKIIDLLERVESKKKIIILDSCHSGTLNINGIPQLNVNESVDQFTDHGYTILSSCGVEEESGFDMTRNMSLYTRFVCDALTSRFLIRKGKKSLNDINNAILHFAKIDNNSNNNKNQHPIFRSNIGGSIFFDVEDYRPYKANQVYEETDDYIIYEVNPTHHANVKRFSISILLRYQMTLEEIAKVSEEIIKKAIHYEVYNMVLFWV